MPSGHRRDEKWCPPDGTLCRQQRAAGPAATCASPEGSGPRTAGRPSCGSLRPLPWSAAVAPVSSPQPPERGSHGFLCPRRRGERPRTRSAPPWAGVRTLVGFGKAEAHFIRKCGMGF